MGETDGRRPAYDEKICPICKNTFIVYDRKNYGYKTRRGTRLYLMCSWHCLNAFKAETAQIMKNKRSKRGRKKREKTGDIHESK